jgi:transcriptional regulator with XRE-family HTH domain
MSKRTLPTYPHYARLAEALGVRIRAARLRRRMSQTEMAERIGVSRLTLRSLEGGDLSVGFGVLVRALGVLGLEDDIARLAADDEVGRRLADAAATPLRRTSTIRRIAPALAVPLAELLEEDPVYPGDDSRPRTERLSAAIREVMWPHDPVRYPSPAEAGGRAEIADLTPGEIIDGMSAIDARRG